MKRRRFLRAMAWTAGGGFVGGSLGAGGILAAIQPRRHRLPPLSPESEQRPQRIGAPRRVVVVGGGLAGIAAATELAERGLQVTLLERARHLGGKAAGWLVDGPGGRVPM